MSTQITGAHAEWDIHKPHIQQMKNIYDYTMNSENLTEK